MSGNDGGKAEPERLLAAESRRSEASQDGRWAEGVDSREGREPRIEDGVFAYDDPEAEQLEGIVSSIVTLPGATTPDGLHPQPLQLLSRQRHIATKPRPPRWYSRISNAAPHY